VGDDDLARLHAPLGLDLGGSSPQETALSILAEVVAARTGRTGLPLRDLRGPIHPADVAVHAEDRPTCEPARPIPTR
jgi:xanthine dehydrogenase accessory factor